MTESKQEIKIKRTKSFLFVFPMLGDTVNDFLDIETKELKKQHPNKFIDTPLINAYIGDIDKPEYNNHIFVLYKFFKSKAYGYLVEQLESHPCFVEMYNINPTYEMFVFQVTDDFQLEYDLFKSEKPRIYRRFSETYKQHILKFLDPLIDSKAIESILYSHEKRFKEQEELIGQPIPRDLDNYSIPLIVEETFNKKQFLNQN
jgi:hypothetical protein